MANDIQNCTDLENPKTPINQIGEKQKTKTKEDIESILKSNTDEDLILKLILLLRIKSKKDSLKIHDICNELKNRKLIDIIPGGKIAYVEAKYGLYGYQTPQNTFKYFSITPELKIKHTGFEFDNNIIQIADFDYFDYNNNLFLGKFSGVKHLFQLDEKDLTFNYLFTSDNNNPLVDADVTLIEDHIILHFQLKKGPIVECLGKIIDGKVKILLNNGLKDLELRDNGLIFGTEIKKGNKFIGSLIEDEVSIKYEINKFYNFLAIDFSDNKTLITINNGTKIFETFIFNPNFGIKEIKNFNVLGIKDITSKNFESLLGFLEGKKIIAFNGCMYKFDVEKNTILSWGSFDKKSEIIKTQKSIYVPKKGFRYFEGVIYKLGMLNLKQKQIQKINEKNPDDLNNYFDEITL